MSVIGPNGAGKTTLFNLVTGIYQPDDGEIRVNGRSIVGMEPHQITRLGVARTFQTLRLFLNLSVRENVMAAAYGRTKAGVFRSMLRTPGMRREEAEIRALAEEKLSFFGERLKGYRWDQPAYSLSYANRRRLEIARAMATGPEILLLDEPAAGMNPVETHEITELIGQLRSEGGYTILVIEHDMHVVEGISDRVVALDHGVKIVEGAFEQVATDPRVIEAYLGTEGRGDQVSLLKLEGINTYYGQIHILQDLNLEVNAGRARLPAGRQRLRQVDDAQDDPRHRALAHRHDHVRRRGRDDSLDEPPHRPRPGDRAGEPAAVRAHDRAGEPRARAPTCTAAGRRRTTSASTSSSRSATTAAGSSRARSRAASSRWSRWRARSCRGRKLMLMDEPSMGLAPILVERSFEIIKQVHESGVAVLVVEQNANVSLSIADRGYVLSTGRLVLEGKAADLLNDEGLRKAYLGR